MINFGVTFLEFKVVYNDEFGKPVKGEHYVKFALYKDKIVLLEGNYEVARGKALGIRTLVMWVNDKRLAIRGYYYRVIACRTFEYQEKGAKATAVADAKELNKVIKNLKEKDYGWRV